MTDYLTAALDELTPDFAGEPGDWQAVVLDARAQRQGRGWMRLSRRRLAVLTIVLAAIAVPLAAVAASQDWWFFRFGAAPTPVTDVIVVDAGSWGGDDWQLIAYLSATDGICFGVGAARSSENHPAAMSCSQIEGVPRTSESKPHTPHSITYLAGSNQDLSTFVVGPVIETATSVAVHLEDGTVVRTPTFDVPPELGAIRFYATGIPLTARRIELLGGTPIRKLVGIDREGVVVACLTIPMPREGASLAACQ